MGRAVGEGDIEYESVLLAYEDGRFVSEVMATAVKLAARRRGGVHVLVTIEVPRSSPIDKAMPEREQAAHEIIERAKVLGGRRVSGRWEKVRAGEAGRVIVNAARGMRAAAVVLPLPPRGGNRLFGSTIATVLAERPCRVIVEAGPSDAASGGPRRSAAAAGR